MECSPLWQETRKVAREHGETNDCWVVAVQIVTGLPYKEVHEAFRQAGRKDRKGTTPYIAAKACELLGYRLYIGFLESSYSNDEYRRLMVKMFGERIKSDQKKKYFTCKNITEHFPEAWADEPPMILRKSGHVAAFKDGKIHDWSHKKAYRITNIYRIEKI